MSLLMSLFGEVNVEGKNHLEHTSLSSEDNIKMNNRELRWEIVNYIGVIQDRHYQRLL
jgi:hypothetical protein